MVGLGDYPASAILRAEDLARAKRFYTEVLGLREIDTGAPAAVGAFSAGGGTTLMIYEMPDMPAPLNTTVVFNVPVERFGGLVSDLRDKGVTFEEVKVSESGLTTVDGIAELGGTKAAWFKDSEGNIVNVAGT